MVVLCGRLLVFAEDTEPPDTPSPACGGSTATVASSTSTSTTAASWRSKAESARFGVRSSSAGDAAERAPPVREVLAGGSLGEAEALLFDSGVAAGAGAGAGAPPPQRVAVAARDTELLSLPGKKSPAISRPHLRVRCLT